MTSSSHIKGYLETVFVIDSDLELSFPSIFGWEDTLRCVQKREGELGSVPVLGWNPPLPLINCALGQWLNVSKPQFPCWWVLLDQMRDERKHLALSGTVTPNTLHFICPCLFSLYLGKVSLHCCRKKSICPFLRDLPERRLFSHLPGSQQLYFQEFLPPF